MQMWKERTEYTKLHSDIYVYVHMHTLMLKLIITRVPCIITKNFN